MYPIESGFSKQDLVEFAYVEKLLLTLALAYRLKEIFVWLLYIFVLMVFFIVLLLKQRVSEPIKFLQIPITRFLMLIG